MKLIFSVKQFFALVVQFSALLTYLKVDAFNLSNSFEVSVILLLVLSILVNIAFAVNQYKGKESFSQEHLKDKLSQSNQGYSPLYYH